MTDGRKRTARVLATLCITAVSGTMLVAAPTYADPDIDTVQSRVDKLYQQAEQASERYNDARLEMKQAQTRLAALQADLGRQQTKVDDVREQVASAVVSQYQGQALSSTTQVLLSQDPDAFLNQLTTVSEYNDQQSQMMADFAVQAKQLEMRQAAAKRELDRIAATKKELGHEKAEIDSKAAEAKGLLGRLKDRAAAASRSAQRSTAAPAAAAPSTNVAASGRAGAAVSYALAQVGDAYVYGAAGPSAFDCSGPHDDGLGPGRRRPPALLERADGLRHPGLAVRAAARRPGVLLQPGQPRRHVHRQRDDRARGQPRQRRDHGPGELDAVLRCRPTGLTDASWPVAPVGGRPASCSPCLAVVAGGILLAGRGPETAVLPPAGPSTSTGADAGDGTRGGRRRGPARAGSPTRLRDGSRADVVALAAPGVPGAARELAALRANVRALGLTDLSLRYVDEDDASPTTGPARALGDRAWVGDVQAGVAGRRLRHRTTAAARSR